MEFAEIIKQMKLERELALSKYKQKDEQCREAVIDEIMSNINATIEQFREIKEICHGPLFINDCKNNFGISSFDHYIEGFKLDSFKIEYDKFMSSGRYVLNRDTFANLEYDKLLQAKIDVGNILHRFDLLMCEEIRKYQSETDRLLRVSNM